MPKRITFCALIMLVLCAFVAVNKTNAQTVYGISGFDYDEGTHQLYGYHATQLDYYAWLYYDAYVEGFIYDRFGNELDFDSDLDTGGLAEAYTQTTYSPGQTYYVISDHYVGAYYYYEEPGGGISYWNPFGFGFAGPGGGYGGLFGFSPGPEVYTYYQLYYLGWTGWEIVFAGEPHIDQMIPTSAPLGVSIEVNFSGSNFGLSPTINVGGSGVTVESITYTTDTRITAIFRIADNASTGNHSVSVSSNGFTSNSVNLMVGDRTPQITSINPSSGNAGDTVGVTITGTGFGSNPSVNVSGINVSVTSRGDQQITANFSIPTTATPGSHQVTVTSNGVGGSGFISGGGSSSTSNPVNFTVNAPAAPRIINYSPQSAQLGTNIEINIQGDNFGTSGTVQISGSGVTVTGYTPVADPAHQIVAQVSIAENAPTGNRSLTVVAGGLTSNSVNFQVGDRSPVIDTITPASGIRGSATEVVLTGHGFGASPTLQISGTGVNITINSATDSRIVATFSISGLAEELLRTVTLTSRGVNGNGFTQTPGATPTAQKTFDINSARVKINSIDKRFAPSVERLNITYSITPSGYSAPVGKLEIFKKGDSTNPIYRDTSIATGGTNVPYSQGGQAGWDGKANMGQESGRFMGPENSPYLVRITIASDGTFVTRQMAEKSFAIEFDSVETTPNYHNELNIIKPIPAPNPEEIATEIKAIIKLKNKAGQGVATQVPFKLHWSFKDPDDTAEKTGIDTDGQGDDNAPAENHGKRITTATPPGTVSILWKAVTGTTTTVDPAGQTAISDSIETAGADQGSAKISFLSSIMAGDNYELHLEIKNKEGVRVDKEIKFEKWSVRKSLVFTSFFKMQGGVDVKSAASKENVDPAFSGDGYTDYRTGNTQTNLTAAQSPEFLLTMLNPNPSTHATQPELPTQQELTDYASTNPTTKANAKTAIEAKAQSWVDRNINDKRYGDDLVQYAQSIGATAYSLIGARYLHEKLDGRDNPNGTNYYPAGIEITGKDGQKHDPDADWGQLNGTEVEHYAFIYLNTQPEERLIIAARHEVGHASDHTLFGPGDHGLHGLMHPAAEPLLPDFPNGNRNFSDNSILHLRGWVF